jgi:hypothetical protein
MEEPEESKRLEIHPKILIYERVSVQQVLEAREIRQVCCRDAVFVVPRYHLRDFAGLELCGFDRQEIVKGTSTLAQRL